ncbi:MAG: Hsp20/alpha crystallin family protein [Patescibacteria group bacterium]
MGKKPSFLERLTGVLEEEETKERAVLTNNDKNRSDDDDDDEAETVEPIKPQTAEMEKFKTAKTKKISLPAEETSKPAENWLPDSEGQLTIDVYQTPAEIVIKSTIAGVSPEDLDITITNDMVTVKGKREKDEVITEGDYYYQECYWGAFSRSVILPVDVEAEKAEASMKNGILTIRLPKIEKIKTRKIKIAAN